MELLETIVGQISLLDIQALRLSGIGSRHTMMDEFLRTEVQTRIDKLHPLFHTARRVGFFPFDAAFCSPLDFACVEHLGLFDMDADTLRTVARDLKAVKRLTVLTNDGCEDYTERLTYVDRVTMIPEGLSLLEGLTGLDLSGHDLTRLPEAVLQLRKLRWLDISDNPSLRALPYEMGERLCHLEQISLSGTQVRNLPRSLLESLERNHGWCEPDCDIGMRGYRGDRLSVRVFPKLAGCHVTYEWEATMFTGRRTLFRDVPRISLCRRRFL